MSGCWQGWGGEAGQGGGACGGAGRAEHAAAQPRAQCGAPSLPSAAIRRHESCSGGTRLFPSGAVAAAVQLGVSREHRAAGPAGQDR